MDTNTAPTAHPGPELDAVHEVRGSFPSPEHMQEAIRRLESSGFDRGDLSVLEMGAEGPDSGAGAADTDDDARQARTLHTSGAAAVAALAAVGITIGTGGAAAPAVAAALLAGTAVGGATFAVSSVANNAEQQNREVKAAFGELILSVRATTATRGQDAATTMCAAGATEIVTL